jgi:hypothetical protein
VEQSRIFIEADPASFTQHRARDERDTNSSFSHPVVWYEEILNLSIEKIAFKATSTGGVPGSGGVSRSPDRSGEAKVFPA